MTARLASERALSVAVVVPTVNEALTIAPIVGELVALRRAGAVDRVVVLDASTDATPGLAEGAGAEVVRQADVCPEAGALVGKGDAMWRALAVCDEDVLVFVDGDTSDFSGTTAALLAEAATLGEAAFVKASYRRPFRSGGITTPTGGGRVTELTAKPLLAAFAPELRRFEQPLAGEIAARTSLLRTLSFATGYAVDVALLIDAWRAVGIEGMAQVDTGTRQNRHRPLEQLGPMAVEVTAAILERFGVPNAAGQPLLERPPMDAWRPAQVAA